MTDDRDLEDVPLDDSFAAHAWSRDLPGDDVFVQNESQLEEDRLKRDVMRKETTKDERLLDCTQGVDGNLTESDEKAQLIDQILELQSTLEDLARRVESVTEENMKFKSENQVLAQYIENLLASSATFQHATKQPKDES
ncbi:short coiled-coil protein A-like [Corticium candelabrum]|uniref:short coiled-coil protein A-like n=1 Tax=Corticium candelabrum TaxID=121492 RepID=UPI002E272255|nr:short coiled-coil protein A-like [Corticium candelabrum]